MADLIAIGYPDQATAEAAAEEARRLAKDLIIQPDAIAVIARDEDGSYHVHTNHHVVGGGATWGMFWGLLFGLLFFIPAFGMAVGAGMGALMGKMAKTSIDKQFQEQVRGMLQPGTSALFLLLEKVTPDKAVEAMSKYGGTVLKTSLSKEDEKELALIMHGGGAERGASSSGAGERFEDPVSRPLEVRGDDPAPERRPVLDHRGSPEPGFRETPLRLLAADLPERAPVGHRISLQVWISVLGVVAGSSAPLKSFDVPAEGRSVTITVSAPGLVPRGDLEQDLHVPAREDSEPIRFGFTTGRAGLHMIRVRAYAGGTFLGELALEISVEVGATLEEGPIREAVLGALAAEPGEVTLQVSRTEDDRYSFQLIAEALYPMELTKRLAGDPTEVVKALVDELRAMAARTSPFTTSALVRNRIKSLGAQMWADAVPEAIRRQFWAQAGRIKLFTVASDMDTVPWELLYPVDGDNDNGFLVEQFPVVRRVYGQGRVRRLPIASAAYIVPQGSPSNAMAEIQAVRARLGHGVRDEGVVERLDSLIALLDGPPSVLHFSCHNQFTDKRGSEVALAGGPLRPSDLAVAVQKHSLEAASPLVFFNACRTAGEIPGLMQMMGWAKQFMGAGAGAFVGSLWAVRSSSARVFADAFYQALVTEEKTLGIASLQARQAIAEDNGDPSWLAYTVYGNPSATIRERKQT